MSLGWRSCWASRNLHGERLLGLVINLCDALDERIAAVAHINHNGSLGAVSSETFIRPERGMLLSTSRAWFGPYGAVGTFFESLALLLGQNHWSFGVVEGCGSAFLVPRAGELPYVIALW